MEEETSTNSPGFGETPDSGVELNKKADFDLVNYIMEASSGTEMTAEWVEPFPASTTGEGSLGDGENEGQPSRHGFGGLVMQLSQSQYRSGEEGQWPPSSQGQGQGQGYIHLTPHSSYQYNGHLNHNHVPQPIQSPHQRLPALRTSSRMELQRKKAMEEQQREEHFQTTINNPPPQSTPVDLPPLTLPCDPQSIPRQLLKVETKLENPTPYHLKQCVRNNITRFALENAQRSGSVPPATFAATTGALGQNELRPSTLPAQPGSAPPNIFAIEPRSPLVTTVPSLPTPQSINSSSLGTSIASGCSDLNEPMAALDVESDLNMFTLAEINEMIGSQDEGTGDIFNYATPSSNFMPSPHTPGSHSGSHTPNALPPGQTSATPIHSPEGEVGDVRAAKDRQKKDNHNKIERRRRYLINDMITLQGQELPKPSEPYYERFGDVKQNKGAILQASYDYIKILKNENESFRQKDTKAQSKLQEMEQKNRKLLLRIQELESLCSGSGITIPEENLTWRPQQPDRISSLINEPITIKQEPDLMMEEGIVVGDPMLLGATDDFSVDDIGMELS